MSEILTGERPSHTPVAAQPHLTVDELSVSYLGQDSWVLREVSLTQFTGQVTAIIGPSGCGKTTLVRAICGLVPHCLPSVYSGSVRLAGTEIAEATVQLLATQVAYVGQSPDAAVITRSVHDDVAFALQNLCLDAEVIESRIREALAAVGLTDRMWDDPWTLSGGQRQRLAIAVALAMRPALLVLDEPTSMIDTTGRQEFYDLIRELASAGTGVVVIDHDLDPILPVCGHVVALNASGAVIAHGTPREVFLGHSAALGACGVWLPRALRIDEPPTGDMPLTCAEAGIHLPCVTDLCGSGVRYLQRAPEGWQEIDAIDTAPTGTTPTVDLADFGVLGRSPAISLRLGGSEFVAVVGPNGSGKTSLLAALAGLITAEARRADIGGTRVRRGRHRVGYVFQNPEHQMVASSVAGELSVGGADPQRLDALLEQFHLTDQRDQHPMTLSGGQARRLSVATMVAEHREVIVLDEPTYGQDWASMCELVAFIDDLRTEGRTVIMATHDLELALRHASHIVALPAPEPSPPITRPTSARTASQPGAFSGINPFTLLFALFPAMVMVLMLRNPLLNLGLLASATLAMTAARATKARTIASALVPWGLTGLLLLLFQHNYTLGELPGQLDYGGNALTAATSIGALIAVVVLSGIGTQPEALLRTLTTTFRLPYRLTSAGTAAVAFVTRFQQDFRLLRTARALRDVGRRWGPLAPVVRWVGSFVPLTILAVQHGERVALSMDARGFGAFSRRTELEETPWRLRDWLVMLTLWTMTGLLWWWLS